MTTATALMSKKVDHQDDPGHRVAKLIGEKEQQPSDDDVPHSARTGGSTNNQYPPDHNIIKRPQSTIPRTIHQS